MTRPISCEATSAAAGVALGRRGSKRADDPPQHLG